MSQFIQNILQRHLGRNKPVLPRKRGVFEPTSINASSVPLDFAETQAPTFVNSIEQPIDRNNPSIPGEKKVPFFPPLNTNSQEASPKTSSNSSHNQTSNSFFLQENNKQLQVPLLPLKEVKENNFVQDKTAIAVNFSNIENPKVINNAAENKPIFSLMEKQQLTAATLEFQALNSKQPISNHSINKSNLQQATAPIPPTIKVHIGRIEVKAVTPPPVKKSQKKKSKMPNLSLEQYLKNSK